MITNIEFKESGIEKFNKWFSESAKENVDMQTVMFECLDIIQDRVSSNETLFYELRGQYTQSGRPEHFYLNHEDIEISEENDE